MKPPSFLAPLLLCLFVTVACTKEKTTAKETAHDITSVSGPTSAAVNTSALLTVTYPYSNGCDFIERFTETKSGNTITIKAITKPVPQEAICTQDAGFRTLTYSFTATNPGTYLLQFLKLNGSTVNHSISVQ